MVKLTKLEIYKRWKKETAPFKDISDKHGKESCYINYGCRCDLCKAAMSEARQARRERVKKRDIRYDAATSEDY